MQAFVIALVILGFLAVVYQGIAFSSRQASSGGEPPPVTIQTR